MIPPAHRRGKRCAYKTLCLFRDREHSGVLAYFCAEPFGKLVRHNNTCNTVPVQRETTGDAPFTLHVKVLRIVFRKTDGKEFELPKHEELKVGMHGGDLSQQTMAGGRIRCPELGNKLWPTLVGFHI